MNAETAKLSYSELIGKLQGLCADGRIGTMFITTEKGHAARFILNRGKIVACTYRLQHGMGALPSLMKINTATYTFTDGVSDSTNDASLPATELVLGWLASGAFSSGPATPAPAAAPRQQPKKTDFSGSREIKTIESTLTEFIGPIAGMTVEDYVQERGAPNGPEDIVAMVNTLAKEEIDDPAKRQQFIQRIHDSFG